MKQLSVSLTILFAFVLAACQPGLPASRVVPTELPETKPPATEPPPAATLPQAEPPVATLQPTLPATQAPLSQFPAGLVYTIGAGNGLWLVGSDGESQLLSDGQYPVLSPDQQHVLYSISYDGEIWLSDLSTGESYNLTNTPDKLEGNFQWWPANPDWIVFNFQPADNPGQGAGFLAMIKADGTDYRILDGEIGSISPASPSPDGKTIALDRGGSPWLYRLEGGLEPIDLGTYGLNFERAAYPKWSPDGQLLAWKAYGADGSSGVAVLDMAQGKGSLLHPYPMVGGSEMFAQMAWSPDGQWLAVNNQAEKAGDRVSLWALRVDGGEEHYLGGLASAPAWSPDSQQLVYSQLLSSSSSFDQSQTILVEVSSWQPTPVDLPGGAQPEEWVTLRP